MIKDIATVLPCLASNFFSYFYIICEILRRVCFFISCRLHQSLLFIPGHSQFFFSRVMIFSRFSARCSLSITENQEISMALFVQSSNFLTLSTPSVWSPAVWAFCLPCRTVESFLLTPFLKERIFHIEPALQKDIPHSVESCISKHFLHNIKHLPAVLFISHLLLCLKVPLNVYLNHVDIKNKWLFLSLLAPKSMCACICILFCI